MAQKRTIQIDIDGNGHHADWSAEKSATITGNSPASATTATIGSAITGCAPYRYLTVIADTIRGGTGGTLDLIIQTSFDGGITWWDYAAFAQQAGGGAANSKIFKVIKGAQITTIATPTTDTLAAGTVIGGAWGDQFRLRGIAGAGTSAGATQTIKFYFSS